MRKTLYMTVGLPRSGKSTWAQNQDWPMVNPDSVRLAIHGQPFIAQAEPYVWAITETMIRALFLAGHDQVILDATNVTRKRRDRWINKDWQVKYVLVPTDKEECIRRTKITKADYLVPIIEKMASEYEPLEADELNRVFETVGQTCQFKGLISSV